MPKLRDPDETREPLRADEPVREPIRAEEGERTRRRQGTQVHSKFHIPVEMIPAGLSIEWKRDEVMGKPDYHYARDLAEQGWRPCDHSMFPALFAPKGTAGAIKIDGMILMERPVHLTEEAKAEDYQRATGALRAAQFQLEATPDGSLPRTKAKVSTTVEPMVVPD
jgi:hypothetical protein